MDKVMHFEIPANDVERAKKFYSEIFTWQITSVPEMEYTMVRTVEVDEKQMPKEPGAINGGIVKKTKEAPTPTIVAVVNDIDKCVEKIKKAGGKIVMGKQVIGDMGLYVKFKDLDGNVLGIWQELKKNG